MRQVVLDYSTGKIKLIEAPIPILKANNLLVKNAYSAMSIGTETNMIRFARMNIVRKALERPDLLREVLKFAKSEGYLEAYRQAKARLATYFPLGYSSAGIVEEIGDNVREFRKGDKVACAGSEIATHSEIISVPKNMCVHVPPGVDLEEAAFAGLGAIVINTARLANASIGETIAVIGTGLLGLLTVQVLKTMGCSVLAVDINAKKLELAQKLGADEIALVRKNNYDTVYSAARSLSGGHGVDCTIIFASTKSQKPLLIAAEITREKGRVLAPGLVGLRIPREEFYKKELSFIIPRAFGPGSYDENYIYKGIDYPLPYVRWTVRRNMETFLKLVKEGKVKVKPLITHKFSIDEAEKVYEDLVNRKLRGVIGILFTYPQAVETTKTIVLRYPITKKRKKTIGIGLIGAGQFARGTILPILHKIRDIELLGVATASSHTGRYVAEKFGFEYHTTDYRKILNDDRIDAVFILTRHSTHARFVIEALESGKNIFVEKPLAVTLDELKKIIEAYNKNPRIVMVGFNRRFAPFSIKAKEFIKEGGNDPLIINIRVNTGYIPKEHWVHDPKEGGRIIGEVCHFVDLAYFFAESDPIRIYTENITETKTYLPDDNVSILIKFQNGSIATINYVSSGDKAFSRERVEIFGNNSVAVIENFKKLILSREGHKKTYRKFSLDRGHKNEIQSFIRSIKEGRPEVPFEEYIVSSYTTIKILESLKRKTPIDIRIKIKKKT